MRNQYKWQLTLLAAAAALSLTGCRLAPAIATAEKIKALHPQASAAPSCFETETEEEALNEAEADETEMLESVFTAAGMSEEMSEAMTEADTLSGNALTAPDDNDFIVAGKPFSEIIPELPAVWPVKAEHLVPGFWLLKDANLPQPRKSMAMLQKNLERKFAATDGTWSICIYDLKNDEEICINDTAMPSASLMKLFILGCAYDEISRGNLTRSSELVAWMSGMIRVSSNGDANRTIAAIGGGDYKTGVQRVNEYIHAQGYSEDTILYNPFQDASLVLDKDHSNQTTARDCAQLFYRIYHRTFSSRKNCNEAEDWMLNQQTRYKLPSIAPEGVTIGNKTGETDTVENDTAVFYTPKGDYIVSILSTGWSNKNAAQTCIKEVSAEIYKYFSSDDYKAGTFVLPTL